MKTTFGASIICMDHLNLERELRFLEEIKIDRLHLDVMDGKYVPRYGIYPEIVEHMAEMTDLPMDLHIMTENPYFTAKQFIHVKNISHISVHIDGNEGSFKQISDFIHKHEKYLGVVAKLDSDIKKIAKLISSGDADSVMFMGITPGVLIQEHQPESLIYNVKKFFKNLELVDDLFIQADGGVNFATVSPFKSSGVNNFVCGTSTLFSGRKKKSGWDYNKQTFSKNLLRLRELSKVVKP